MVKLNMSTDGSENEFNSLTSTIDKLKIQQRLIDISARNLQSARLSCSEFPSSLTSSSEAQSTIEENVLLLEVSLADKFKLVKRTYKAARHAAISEGPGRVHTCQV